MEIEKEGLQGDPAKVDELFREFHSWFKDYINAAEKAAEKAATLNKEVSSFYERLLLIALGVLGLSITSLTSFAPRLSANAYAHKILQHWVIPAWILLVLCVFMSRNVMAYILRTNRHIFNEWNSKVDSYNSQQVVRSVTKLAKAVTGKIEVNSELRSVTDVLMEIVKNAQASVDTITKRPTLESLTKSDARFIEWQSRLATMAMQIAMILLCVAAIRLFLL